MSRVSVILIGLLMGMASAGLQRSRSARVSGGLYRTPNRAVNCRAGGDCTGIRQRTSVLPHKNALATIPTTTTERGIASGKSRFEKLVPRAIEIDWSDPDIQLAFAGAFLGLAGGIGFPIFYKLRDDADQDRLKDIREMNRQQFEETGEYMSEDEIASLRPKRYLDDKEFVDDD
eukprot:CAMPEP_0185254756 /NCGR_PEP_ID=MMETSP1359-20130426/3688_1 /TAXON_ID=552665 /ORGANISM="Bigelowiella longifila, Strain CCMP242" /LENGTH=173 /DNA_ID=CAMNT_0027838113 /DNA_START=87 /DNA_END=608 /DNA_ORIENTATION=+